MPGHAVRRRDARVVVVPSLAAAHQRTHQLLREPSRVSKRASAHIWVAEFTSQVACRPSVTRRKTPHRTQPMALPAAREPAQAKEQRAARDEWNPVVLAQPEMNASRAKSGA